MKNIAFLNIFTNFVYQVVISALAVAVANGAPQLLYGGYGGYGYGLGAVHAIPTVAKQTIKYKTAAFEAVDAATPADAQLIELKETEHSHDILVPGPVNYVHTPAVATYAGYPYAGAYGAGVYGGLAGYPYGLHGLPVLAAAPAAAEEAAVAEEPAVAEE